MSNAFYSTVIVAGLLFIGACAGLAWAERANDTCRPLITIAAERGAL